MAAFVDTNILIYAFVGDINGSTAKPAVADSLIAHLVKEDELILSTQVLSEFSANAGCPIHDGFIVMGGVPTTSFSTENLDTRAYN